MKFILIIVVSAILYYVFIRWGRAWLVRRMQRKAEDYLRQAAGFPPREDSGRGSRRSRRAAPRRDESRQSEPPTDVPREMQKVAEDVDFVEYHEYSESVEIHSEADGKSTNVVVEQQVTDAEYVVIPKKEAS